jgi:hypothetical protein
MPLFTRQTGEVEMLAVHHGAVQDEVTFAAPGCACSQGCGEAEVEVLSSSTDGNTIVLSVRAALPLANVPVCVGVKQVATVDFIPGACVFAASARSPCMAEVCLESLEDPEAAEACHQLVAEYCAAHTEDGGCALFVPNFERTVDEESVVHVHTAGLFVESSATFVASDFACGTGCDGADVEVLSLLVDSFEAGLAITFMPHARGEYNVCASPRGGASHSVLVATVTVDGPACMFAMDGPCSAPECDLASGFGTTEGCVQIAAAYCVEHPEDLGLRCSSRASYEPRARLPRFRSTRLALTQAPRPYSCRAGVRAVSLARLRRWT